jgi:hypothetical protein
VRFGAPGASGVGRFSTDRVVRTRPSGRRCRRVRDDARRPADGAPRPWSSRLLTPRRGGLTMWRTTDLRGGDPSPGRPPEVESQNAGNAPAQYGREPTIRFARPLKCSAGTERARHQRDDRNGGNPQAPRDARHRTPIDAAGMDRRRDMRPNFAIVGNCRPLEGALELSRLLAPEIRGTRGRLVRLEGRGPRTEWHQFLAGPEPVAREADDLVPRLSPSLSCLGLLSVAHPIRPFAAISAPIALMLSEPRGSITLN